MKHFLLFSSILAIASGCSSVGVMPFKEEAPKVRVPASSDEVGKSNCGYNLFKKTSELSQTEVDNNILPGFAPDMEKKGRVSSRVVIEQINGVLEVSKGNREETYSFQFLGTNHKASGTLAPYGSRQLQLRKVVDLGDFVLDINCN